MKKGIKRIISGLVNNDTVAAPFCFEMRERRGAVIGGVCGVCETTPECVRLKLRTGETVQINGYKLHCISFGSGGVEVHGRIRAITFEGGSYESV